LLTGIFFVAVRPRGVARDADFRVAPAVLKKRELTKWSWVGSSEGSCEACTRLGGAALGAQSTVGNSGSYEEKKLAKSVSKFQWWEGEEEARFVSAARTCNLNRPAVGRFWQLIIRTCQDINT
jgi:hypothetical protein